jgi:hypothetical protein
MTQAQVGVTTFELGISRTGEASIRCRVCNMTSYSDGDIHHQYCGNCKMYHRDLLMMLKNPNRLSRVWGDNMRALQTAVAQFPEGESVCTKCKNPTDYETLCAFCAPRCRRRRKHPALQPKTEAAFAALRMAGPQAIAELSRWDTYCPECRKSGIGWWKKFAGIFSAAFMIGFAASQIQWTFVSRVGEVPAHCDGNYYPICVIQDERCCIQLPRGTD